MEETIQNSNSNSNSPRKGRALCMCSGGLDSLLVLCLLREQGCEVEAATFSSPFYSNPDTVVKSCTELGFKVNIIDFTADILKLLHDPPSGFGSCMNPCIDCHARMIERAWAWAQEHGFDFIATGEVLGQRPMSQMRHGLNRVQKLSGVGDHLLRPLCAKLLEPTAPEREGLVDREKLLDLSGRNRKPQMALAEKYGIKNYPSPAGGCKLTEPNYSRRLKNLQDHEGLDDPRLIEVLNHGRHFRFPNGSLVVLGRDRADNEFLRTAMRGGDALLRTVNVPGPSALVVHATDEDLVEARKLVAAYADHKGITEITVREMKAAQKPELFTLPVCEREPFRAYML